MYTESYQLNFLIISDKTFSFWTRITLSRGLFSKKRILHIIYIFLNEWHKMTQNVKCFWFMYKTYLKVDSA